MTGTRPGIYWQMTWRYIGPAIMGCILLSSILSMILRNPTYGAWNGELVRERGHMRVFFRAFNPLLYHSPLQGVIENKSYPNWVMGIALAMIIAGVLPMPVVFLLRRFQILKVDLDIHQGSIRRNETTASTKEMIDEDDVSTVAPLWYHVESFFSQQQSGNGCGNFNEVNSAILESFVIRFSILQYGFKLPLQKRNRSKMRLFLKKKALTYTQCAPYSIIIGCYLILRFYFIFFINLYMLSCVRMSVCVIGIGLILL